LHCYENRITDLDVRAQVSESLEVNLTAKFLFEKQQGYASFVLKRPDGSVEVSSPKMSTDGGVGEVSFSFPSGQLQLWYPINYGEQPLYTVEVDITDLASFLFSFWEPEGQSAAGRKCSRDSNTEDWTATCPHCTGEAA
jgi:beta-mannosidase